MAHLNAICSPDNWCQARQNGETQGGVGRLNTHSVTPGLYGDTNNRYMLLINNTSTLFVILECHDFVFIKALLIKHSPKWRKEFCKRCVYSKQLLYMIVYPRICIGWLSASEGDFTTKISVMKNCTQKLICQNVLMSDIVCRNYCNFRQWNIDAARTTIYIIQSRDLPSGCNCFVLDWKLNLEICKSSVLVSCKIYHHFTVIAILHDSAIC